VTGSGHHFLAGTGVSRQTAPVIEAVIFDMDGVLVDSEHLWDEARRAVVSRTGGHWLPEATPAMMGMSSPEWSIYLRDQLRVPLTAEQISHQVVADMLARYREALPLIPGAVEAVKRMAEHFTLGIASSANRPIIEAVLAASELERYFEATVSSEEVGRGKPAPDVYLEAARRLGVGASACGVVEDSTNGIRSAAAAGMTVVAIPNPTFPPPDDVLDMASAVLASIAELEPDLFAAGGAATGGTAPSAPSVEDVV
jgi:HAD superfamily hydrolase (TIGR01509 family)